MLDSTKRRLERLADDAQELDDSSHSMFGFALIAGPKVIRIRDPQRWARIGKYVAIHTEDPLVMTSPPYWVELDPEVRRCISWWGDSEGVERFKEWTERMSSLFEGDATLLGDIAHESGTFGALCALCELAQHKPELSDLVRKRVIRIPEQLLGRQLIQRDKPWKNKVFVLEAAKRGPHFARDIINYLLGQLPRGPRLNVYPERNRVTIDGDGYQLNREYVLVLEVLLKANGNTVSRRSMAEQQPALKHWENDLDHVIKERLPRDCPALRGVIEAVPRKGYRIVKDYLA